MNNTLTISCFGEVLWDVFPDEKKLGGAPLNVAYRLHSFGAKVSMISAIGEDALGIETSAALQSLGMDVSHIQTNALPTGKVTVDLNSGGSPSYMINEHSAWDKITATKENLATVAASDALIFGSLAFRESANQLQFEKLLEASSYNVFDLNLRSPHYDLDVVIALMEAAHFIKMNDEELELITTLMDLSADDLAGELKEIAKASNTETVCVTLGAEGAMLLHKDKIYTQVGFPTTVVDSVGAGDSFLAGLVFGLLSNETPEDSLEIACALGSLVASKKGGTALVSNDEIDDLIFES
jgi:fructokinase